MSGTAAAGHDGSSFAQLNAVLQARGYISRPIDFGELDEEADGKLDAAEELEHEHEHEHAANDEGQPSDGKSDQQSKKQRTRTRKRKQAARIRMSGFADIIQLILSDTARDLDAKTVLSARVRQLEASLARQEKAFRLQGEELIAAQRQASSAQAQVESVASALNSEKVAHKTTTEDLTKLKRDTGSIRLLTSQGKHAAERRAEGLKAKLSDVTIQALLSKGCAADLRVVGGAFGLPSFSSSSSSSNQAPTSLAAEQGVQLEQERSTLLNELTSIKMFATECVNALRSTGLQLAKQVQIERQGGASGKVSGKAKAADPALISRTTTETAFVGDLFPALARYSSTNGLDHPASKVLQQAIEEAEHQASQLALLSAERAECEQRVRSNARMEPKSSEPGTSSSSARTTATEEALRQSYASDRFKLSQLEQRCKQYERELAQCKEREAQAAMMLQLAQQGTGPSSTRSERATTHSRSTKDDVQNLIPQRIPSLQEHKQQVNNDDQELDTTPTEPPPSLRPAVPAARSTTPSMEGTVVDYGSDQETSNSDAHRASRKRKAGDELNVRPGGTRPAAARRFSARLARPDPIAPSTNPLFGGDSRGVNVQGPFESTPLTKRPKTEDGPVGLERAAAPSKRSLLGAGSRGAR